MSQKNSLDTLFNALDKANRAGVFNLNESAAIYAAFGDLAEVINRPVQETEAKDNPQPHPPVTPIKPKKQ